MPQAIVSESLAQGPYVGARTGFEPTTLRTKGEESTTIPPRIQCVVLFVSFKKNYLCLSRRVTLPSVDLIAEVIG